MFSVNIYKDRGFVYDIWSPFAKGYMLMCAFDMFRVYVCPPVLMSVSPYLKQFHILITDTFYLSKKKESMLKKYTYNIHTYHTLQHLQLDIHQVKDRSCRKVYVSLPTDVRQFRLINEIAK